MFYWISAEKRHLFETELFSADYLLDLNPGGIFEFEAELVSAFVALTQ